MTKRVHTSQDLGLAIRAARKRLGLRQDEVALASGVGVRFVGELERGKPTVEIQRVLRVLDVVGLDLWIDERPNA